MDIQIIREFISIANNQNISAVADQYFLSPSLLSLHIRKLEEELGFPLFDRTARRMTLNENGQLFLGYAKRIIAEFDDYKSVSAKGPDLQDVISIGLLGSIAQAATENIIAAFCKKNRDIRLNIVSRDYPDMVYERLANGVCDFAFMYYADISRPDIVKLPLFTDRIVALIPAGHRLYGRESITCEDLRGEHILMQNADVLIFHKVMKFFEAMGVKVNMSFAVNSEVLMEELLSYNAGIGLMINESAKRINKSNISVIEIDQSLLLEFSVSYRKNAELKPISKEFLQFLETNVRQKKPTDV